MPALTKAAFSTLDQKFPPEGTALFNMSRLYGSMMGISVVQLFLYGSMQAMHLALAKNLMPYRVAAHTTSAVSGKGLAMLDEMITRQAWFVGFINEFKIMLIAILVISPLVLFLRKPR